LGCTPAIAGNADCIITGDEDLLTLGKFRTVDILLPRDFIAYEDLLASG
jgi:predicted nucleic acid-binding protein